LANLYVQHAYGEVLSREALDPVTREAVAIASLMNSGNYTQSILEHINAYLNLGGKPEALLEMCFIAIAVMGFPSAINTIGKIRATLKERGIEIARVPEATDDGTERYLMGARYMIANTEGGLQDLQVLTEKNPAFAKILASYGYGDIMTRDGLDARTKTLTTLAMLATQGNAQSWIRITILGGLRQGVSRAESVESMLQLTIHRGSPSATVALFQVKEVFDGLDAGTLLLEPTDGDIPEVALATREARFAQGEVELSKTTGAAGAAVVSSFADMAPDIGNHIMEYLYGDVFSRSQISLRDREVFNRFCLCRNGYLDVTGANAGAFQRAADCGAEKDRDSGSSAEHGCVLL
jgi:4-carboxymuconolactone decarboxylase